MNLTLTASGPGGHTVVTFDGSEIRINFHKTSPKERGMIETLVEKALGGGLKLHRSKSGKPGDALGRILDVLLESKGEVMLLGTQAQVDELAVGLVEEQIRSNRVVAEAQEDGSWKVLRLGDFKAEAKVKETEKGAPAPDVEADKKRAVSSHEKVVGG